jgi:ribosomal-protein-alanine N-acetyltransferase
MSAPVLMTPRLRLRGWRESDLAPLAALSRDPKVMEFFPKLFDRAECEAAVGRTEAHFERHGFGWWAVELIREETFMGYVGLRVVPHQLPFTPAVEAGWRLAREHWGKGYATEAARAALALGFGAKRLDEVVAFTVPANLASRRVMEKIGMTRNPQDDFLHPEVPEGHPLQPHVLYRLKRAAWLSAMG